MATMVTLKDGAEIAVDVSGEGTPVLFVHGWAMQGSLFAGQRDALSSSYQIITVDLRGHGASSRDVTALTIERLGADIVEIADALNLTELVVVGWSMGAMVLWDALTSREFAVRVAGLVSIDMSPRLSNDGAWSLGLADGRGPLAALRAVEAMRADWPNAVRRFAPRIFAPDMTPDRQAQLSAIISDASALNGEAMAALWESMAVQDFRKTIGVLPTPILAVHGAKSQLYPVATGEFIAENAPSGDVAVFPASGHAPHLEEPERFNTALQRFISSVQTSSNSKKPFLSAAR